MNFLVDAQLPPALARLLSAQGHNAKHVADFSMATASDRSIWQMAMQENYIVVTKDDDFIELSRMKPGPKIIWVRTGNIGKRDLLTKFENKIGGIIAALQAGEILVELR